MLSDLEIRRLIFSKEAGEDSIGVYPLPSEDQMQPVSLDLRLGGLLGQMAFAPNEGYWLEAGQFVLGSTQETFSMPRTVVGLVHGKSTWAREGLLVECAGLIDPGFEGQITLELKNLGHQRFRLWLGMFICQVSFSRVEGTVARPYGYPGLNSHYQGQQGPTRARIK